MIFNLLQQLDQWIHFEEASAHCDIPCKVYDPISAQIDALTIIRLLELMEPYLVKDTLSANDTAQLQRLIEQKEQHGNSVKHEIRIIWGDYFKQPHLDEFPKIHQLTHQIMLQTSKVKQHLNIDFAKELLTLVNEFADIFWQTKSIKTAEMTSPYPPFEQVLYPRLGEVKE